MAACLIVLSGPLAAPAESVPNAEFDQGDDAPTGWTLSGGEGCWVDRQVLEVTGNGNDSNFWRCDRVEFQPGGLYHFEMRARRTSGSGCVISGPGFANRDNSALSSEWKWYGHVFRAPENTAGAYLRLGQWQATGTVQFDAVRLTPALPVHRKIGDLVFGEGETIRDGVYQFHGTFGHQGSNYHRTLETATAGFNSNRWCFGPGHQLTYRFAVPRHKLLSGRVAFNVNYHTGGTCRAEISRDQETWHSLAEQRELGAAEAPLPEDLLPADTVFLRLTTTDERASFQVDRIDFEADLDGEPADLTGETAYAEITEGDASLIVEEVTWASSWNHGQPVLRVTVANRGDQPAAVFPTAVVKQGDRSRSLGPDPFGPKLLPGETSTIALGIPPLYPGENEVQFTLAGPNPAASRPTGTLSLIQPEFYRADYGQRLQGIGSGPDTVVWWCDATHKIARQRAAPPELGSGRIVHLQAARNDREAVQIVVRPTKPLKGLTARVSPLRSSKGRLNEIPVENIDILRVFYHFVDHPTDKTGVRDWWPDALPPLDEPIDVPAGQNQPLWILVHVPEDAKADDYQGEIRLEAEGFSATVPIKLHVWDFALPKQNHIDTAFGLSAGNVFRYHQLKTDEDKRRVLDMYLKCFSEHRMSPYDLTPMDPIGVKFLPQADPPRAELDFTAFDRAMTRAVDQFHFTSFRLPIHGMGGGSFHARYEPKIEGFGAETPQYQAMFSSFVKQLEDHLREKGWLDMVYIYWFDEPDPKDYEFVKGGFERLKKYAPGLRTMLTEQPEEALAGPVDVWCPVSPNYDHEAAEKRRAHGDIFWWYVCTGPKAPYCTLFIDHPATELRVWLWQTWQRNIVGNLVWQATYWTSSTAYPDEPQNPYEDPMGYVSGYSTPRGVKRFWGNGDGRFVYPPLAAATPGASGPDPVLDPPVSSIRWEMLREGIEDYEYLYLLRELIAKRGDQLSADDAKKYEALLEVPQSITEDMTTFTTDPAPIYARRADIAEAIEQLIK